jgi:AcrR family transcriptional regulator
MPVPEVTEQQTRRRRGRPAAGAPDAIVVAALNLLSTDGLAQFTTREVARRAGVSEASVFYHFGDKIGLLHQAMLSGLAPLKAIEPDVLAGDVERLLAQTLAEIATGLEAFFDRAMPVLSTVQADAGLRAAFARRLTQGDNGPHRGVQSVDKHLTGMKQRGQVDPAADSQAAALMLVGTCFLRSWQRYLAGPRRKPTLAELAETVNALADFLEPARPGSR